MVLNFGILNKTLSLPILSDQYNTGPRDVTLIKIAIITIGKNKTVNRITEAMMSKSRFILFDKKQSILTGGF